MKFKVVRNVVNQRLNLYLGSSHLSDSDLGARRRHAPQSGLVRVNVRSEGEVDDSPGCLVHV